ncbi:MAG: hypothetical protein PUE18_04640 [Firmicutes bacterium]|nr:hypothetical protein [Bacillota bacterium]
MRRTLEEKDVSHGFRVPVTGVVMMIPQCNVCTNWNGRGKCKVYGETPKEYMNGESHSCEKAILDKENFAYKKYRELYEK